MTHLKFLSFCVALAVTTETFAQSVTSRVTGAAAGATASASAGVGGTNGGSSSPSSQANNPFAALDTPSSGAIGAAGEWGGGVGVKMNGKTVILRGGVGVEDNRGSFRAGAAVPF